MKKLSVLLLIIILAAGVFAGCNPPEIEDTEKNLIIEMYEGGYGIAAFKKIAEDFEAAYAEEGYTVTILPSAVLLGNSVEAKLKAGPKLNATDLFMAGAVNFRKIVDSGANFIKGYDFALADLTEMYNTDVYGEEIKYKDKINAQYYDQNLFDEKVFSTNWAGGPTGFAYNVDFFTSNGWSLPRTTDELISLAAEIKNDGYTPFIWCGTTASYWQYMTLPWWRQLTTDVEAENFWNCIDKYGDQSAEAFKTYARLQSYNMLESLIFDTSNSHSKSMTMTHIQAQTILYEASNKIAMMPTGDWLENEMKSAGYQPGQKNIGFMRAPVMSEVIYIYDDSTGQQNFRFETVRDEATLIRVIDAVDQGENKLSGISDADFAAIKKIRSYANTTGYLSNAMIPEYANAKEAAIKFLLFLASDSSLQTYYNETGTFMPFSATNLTLKTDATKFQSDLLSITQNVNYVTQGDSKNKIFYKTSLGFDVSFVESIIGTSESADKKTGLQYWNYVYEMHASNFDTYLSMVS